MAPLRRDEMLTKFGFTGGGLSIVVWFICGICFPIINIFYAEKVCQMSAEEVVRRFLGMK